LFSKEFIHTHCNCLYYCYTHCWYYMHQWLQAYAYRINISWWLLVAGGLVAIIIALATIISGNKGSNSKPGEEPSAQSRQLQ